MFTWILYMTLCNATHCETEHMAWAIDEEQCHALADVYYARVEEFPDYIKSGAIICLPQDAPAPGSEDPTESPVEGTAL